MTSSSPSGPAPALFQDGASKGITLQGWKVTTSKFPILNATESDAAAATLHLPLPEICFGNNRLRLENLASGLRFEWDAISALLVVEQESGVTVAHAAEWARGQAASSTSNLSVQKPFDWTYTTRHPGTISASPSAGSPPTFTLASPDHPGIPLHLLARQDIPILFFDEVPLFEDELGDNGIAELVVRVRVNATSVFILSRFFLRIDHVLFRTFDVRIYHAFNSSEILRETKGREASYEDVKRHLPSDLPNDLTPLTDVNWVSSVLDKISSPPPPPRARAAWPPSVPTPTEPSLAPDAAMALATDRLRIGDRVPEPPTSSTRWKGEGRELEVLRLDAVA